MAKRTLLVCLVVTVVLALTAGVALAVTKQCSDEFSYVCRGTQGDDTLLGTNSGADDIEGLGGGDRLEGRGGVDSLFGGGGDDTLLGGYGSDGLRPMSGNDALFGGPGPSGDTYAFDRGWDRDTIVDGAQRENDPNTIRIIPFVTSDLVINLVPSGSRSEIRTRDGANTVNWSATTKMQDVWNEGQGDDVILGNNAANFIQSENFGQADGGADKVYAMGGGDLVAVADNAGDDFVDCGEGNDRVLYNPGDTFRNCEIQEEIAL